MAARRAAADGRTANHRWEDIMTARQEWMALRMHGHLALGAAALLAVAAVPSIAQAPGGIPGVLAPSAVPDLVQEGFVFTEGPLGTADGGLYFTDIRVSRIFYLDPGGKISMVRENTNGANGLALTRDGELLFAEGDGKRITKRNQGRHHHHRYRRPVWRAASCAQRPAGGF